MCVLSMSWLTANPLSLSLVQPLVRPLSYCFPIIAGTQLCAAEQSSTVSQAEY